MFDEIDALLSEPPFSGLDLHFSRFMTRLAEEESPELKLACALVSYRTCAGDLCISIPEIAGTPISSVFGDTDVIEAAFVFPERELWLSVLSNSTIVGVPGEYKPLILDEKGRLYFYRYWNYERMLLEGIMSRISITEKIDEELLRQGIERLFPREADEKETDWQRVAACVAVLKHFCAISGGPGTGKTATVVKILMLLFEQAQCHGRTLEIALTAPTGKAAARLKESMKHAGAQPGCDQPGCGQPGCDQPDPDAPGCIPDETYTIHRLLGTRRPSRDAKLPYDVVVVDEASMADCALLAKLFEALKPNARVILLGDKYQLSSVEAGGVFGDICGTGAENDYSAELMQRVEHITGQSIELSLKPKSTAPLAESIGVLKRNYRFATESGIYALSQAVRDGDAELTMSLLRDERFEDITFIDKNSETGRKKNITARIVDGYKHYLQADTADHALKALPRFTVLCALRHGPFGVQGVNGAVEQELRRSRQIKTERQWYRGRPVLILRNDYSVELFNGDIGVIFAENNNDEHGYFNIFTSEGVLRKISPVRLPEHETAFATTVHKSQGSEYDEVLLYLPSKPVRVLTRELLYTAITRARRKIEIWGTEEVMRYAASQRTVRRSGLLYALWSVD